MIIRINGDTEILAADIDCYTKIITWCCEEINLSAESIDVIFVDDKTLRDMHKIYLNDDSFTDVMTFNLGDEDAIESEIYISLTRTQEQAIEYQVSLQEEITRLLVHACLHLVGYDDLKTEDQLIMKDRENELVKLAQDQFLDSCQSD